MIIEDLVNVTADCASGSKESRLYHKILRGVKGKFGIEFHISVTGIERALNGKAYSYVDKTGDRILVVKPKIWPPKVDERPFVKGNRSGSEKPEKLDPEFFNKCIAAAYSDGPTEPKEGGPIEHPDLDDQIPF